MWGRRDDSEPAPPRATDSAHEGCSPNSRAFTQPSAPREIDVRIQTSEIFTCMTGKGLIRSLRRLTAVPSMSIVRGTCSSSRSHVIAHPRDASDGTPIPLQARAMTLSSVTMASIVPSMVHICDDGAPESGRCSILPPFQRTGASARMARRAVSGRSQIDRSGSDEGRVWMAVRTTALCVAHGLFRVVRGAQQRDGRTHRQGVLYRVGKNHGASARIHQENPGDVGERTDTCTSPNEGVHPK